jgi:tetratricopeptide (TPR) repeat protein
MTGQTDWLSALAILAAGLILGFLLIYFFGRRKSAPVSDNLELRDLEARRDTLVAQLRDGDELSGDERTRLELETAQVLRQLDRVSVTAVRKDTAPVKAAAEQTRPDIRRATMIGFAWGAGTVAALGFLGYLVTTSLSPREDQAAAPQPMQQPQQANRPDPALQQLEAAVKSQPDNLELRTDLAQAYLERENLMGVFEQTQFVLAKQPEHSRAMTFEALVRLAMGESATAVTMLEKATKNDPKLLDAWVALAWVRTQEGNKKEAERTMQEAMRQRPEEKVRLQEVLDQMMAHTDDPNAQTAGSELPAGHPPVGPDSPRVGPATTTAATTPAATTPQRVPAANPQAVRITLEVDAAARSRAGGNAVLFVTARPAGVTAGPPVAAKRMVVQSFPVTFDLSASDSMMGQALPASMRVEARLDSDGNAATRNPGDPVAAQDRVTMGSQITLAMR